MLETNSEVMQEEVKPEDKYQQRPQYLVTWEQEPIVSVQPYIYMHYPELFNRLFGSGAEEKWTD